MNYIIHGEQTVLFKFTPKSENVTGGYRELHGEKHINIICSNITGCQIKENELGRRVARVGMMRNAQTFVGNIEGNTIGRAALK
jgi:hypothetical protein